jgi:hypothetical protein
VQEEPDTIGMAALAKLLSHRDQLIVMHPNNVVRAQELGEFAGKVPVDAEISGEVAPREFG